MLCSNLLVLVIGGFSVLFLDTPGVLSSCELTFMLGCGNFHFGKKVVSLVETYLGLIHHEFID